VDGSTRPGPYTMSCHRTIYACVNKIGWVVPFHHHDELLTYIAVSLVAGESITRLAEGDEGRHMGRAREWRPRRDRCRGGDSVCNNTVLSFLNFFTVYIYTYLLPILMDD
jgi:hypothetical protein